MLSGKMAKPEQGELAVPLPIGYVRRPAGKVIFDPDEQAQHMVCLVFGAFAQRSAPWRPCRSQAPPQWSDQPRPGRLRNGRHGPDEPPTSEARNPDKPHNRQAARNSHPETARGGERVETPRTAFNR
jgi:hypothetical protein